MSNVAARPLFLPASGLPWPRRLGVVVAVGSLLSVWARVTAAPHRLDWQALLVTASLALSLALFNLNHVGAQIAARGLWWAQFLFGLVLCWVKPDGFEREALAVVLGGGGALLLAGSAGLRADAPTRGAFAPVAFRRTLLVSIALSVAEVQALGVASSGLLGADDPLGVELGACALLLAAGLIGLYRLRFWGVLLHWLGTALLAAFAVRALRAAAEADVVYVWGAGVVVQLLLPLPMLLAIARRTPVAPAAASPLAPRLFFGAVAALMLASAGSLVWARL
ncbi:MAG TPA: hypothetical protein VFS43_19625 [Polyangiaceae bacterium]|nr:hypothetical protein [Polyangiaceae bacterium]